MGYYGWLINDAEILCTYIQDEYTKKVLYSSIDAIKHLEEHIKMNRTQKIEIIRTALQSITSFNVHAEVTEREAKIRIKLVILKDYIKRIPLPYFDTQSCWSIVFDVITDIRKLINDYTCCEDNYRMVMKFLASDDFKEREHETCSELSERTQSS